MANERTTGSTATRDSSIYSFDTSRSGRVSRDVMGEHFTGTLVADCYAGYEAHTAGAKQKCRFNHK